MRKLIEVKELSVSGKPVGVLQLEKVDGEFILSGLCPERYIYHFDTEEAAMDWIHRCGLYQVLYVAD